MISEAAKQHSSAPSMGWRIFMFFCKGLWLRILFDQSWKYMERL